MANVSVPNGSVVSIASTYGTPATITAITNATEAVATLSASHGIVVGDIFVVSSGWSRLNNIAVRAKTVATNDVTLEGFDSSNTTTFPPGTGTGTIKEVTAFTTIVGMLDMSTSGGDQQFATYSLLEEFDERQIPTVRSPISLTMTIADDATAAHYTVLSGADADRLARVVRLVLPNGSKLYYNGIVTLNKTPTLTKNQPMGLNVSFSLQSAVTRYAT